MAQALIGKTVGLIGGAMYSQYRCVPAAQVLLFPEGTTPAEGASSFVNPLTSLGMVETMRLEGHTALVHTAAASNLGQMLQQASLSDDVTKRLHHKTEIGIALRENVRCFTTHHASIVKSVALNSATQLSDCCHETTRLNHRRARRDDRRARRRRTGV